MMIKFDIDYFFIYRAGGGRELDATFNDTKIIAPPISIMNAH